MQPVLSPKMLTVLRCLDVGKPVIRKQQTLNAGAASYFVGRRRGMGCTIEALQRAGLIEVVTRQRDRYWRVYYYGLTEKGRAVVEGRG